MNELNIDYNNLTAARKAKVELYKIKITNHPDYPNETVTVVLPKYLIDLIRA